MDFCVITFLLFRIGACQADGFWPTSISEAIPIKPRGELRNFNRNEIKMQLLIMSLCNGLQILLFPKSDFLFQTKAYRLYEVTICIQQQAPRDAFNQTMFPVTA